MPGSQNIADCIDATVSRWTPWGREMIRISTRVFLDKLEKTPSLLAIFHSTVSSAFQPILPIVTAKVMGMEQEMSEAQRIRVHATMSGGDENQRPNFDRRGFFSDSLYHAVNRQAYLTISPQKKMDIFMYFLQEWEMSIYLNKYLQNPKYAKNSDQNYEEDPTLYPRSLEYTLIHLEFRDQVCLSLSILPGKVSMDTSTSIVTVFKNTVCSFKFPLECTEPFWLKGEYYEKGGMGKLSQKQQLLKDVIEC